MFMKLYSINDMKAGVFFPPFLSENDFSAQRNVAQAIAGNAGLLSTHPQDHRLFCLGQIDRVTGVIEAEPAPVLVCDCLTLAPAPSADPVPVIEALPFQPNESE